jgi:hypothetical protein
MSLRMTGQGVGSPLVRWIRSAEGEVVSPTDGGGSSHLGRGRDVARLVAGLADFGLEQAEGLLHRARGVLNRNDYTDLAADAHADLVARGEVVLARLAPSAEPHMEALARIAKQTRDIPDSDFPGRDIPDTA